MSGTAGLTIGALVALLGVACATAPGAAVDDRTPPVRVSVRPLFVVPTGASGPTDAQRDLLARHLLWARWRYVELLGPAGSFALDTAAEVVTAAHPWSYYRGRFETGVPEITVELLAHFGVTCFSDPWVFVIIVMNPAVDEPVGGGRPINGYFNNGGGIVVRSSYALDNHPFIQSTLQHELGHAFGLVHVDVYGRNMDTDSSMMSYNPAHHTNGVEDASEPGVFAAEDRAALALNQRGFPGLTYGGPPGATLIALGPMTLPGLPHWTGP